MKTFLDKETQSELKARYTKALMEYWNEPTPQGKMVKCCLSSIVLFVPVMGGKYIIPIEKERINKHFYFGYSDCGQGRSYEENRELVNHVEKHLEDHFMMENMETVDRRINHVKDYLKYERCTGDIPHMYVYPHYYQQAENSVLGSFSILNPNYDFIPEGSIEISFADARNILKAYKESKVLHEKKLKTYLKKYGTKHMFVSTYWVDR